MSQYPIGTVNKYSHNKYIYIPDFVIELVHTKVGIPNSKKNK